MLFRVSRAGYSYSKPCDAAFKSDYARRDERTVSSPESIPMYDGDKASADADWYGRGTNHRVENGRIVRDLEDTDWFIEVTDLNGLLELARCYDEAKVVPDSDRSPDSWRLILGDVE